MLLLLLLPVVSGAPARGWCGHDLDQRAAVVSVAPLPRHAAAGGAARAPIRIHFEDSAILGDTDPNRCRTVGQVVSYRTPENGQHICTAADILSAAEAAHVVALARGAADRWSTLLSVAPVGGALTYAPDTCYSVPVPQPAHRSGVADTDLVLHLSARVPKSTGTIASAVYCQRDGTGGRPTVGMLQLSPAHYKRRVDVNDYIMVLMHEIGHVLGVYGGLFLNHQLKRTFSAPLNKAVTYFTGASATAAARAHFNCTTLTGVELEDDGGAGTASSHFEDRVYDNELMTGTGDDSRVTTITLSVLADLGWYTVNYSAADSLLFGSGGGCTLAVDRCANWPAGDTCPVVGAETCVPSSGLTRRGSCAVGFLADGCARPVTHRNGACTTEANASPSLVTGKMYGMVHGPGSLCFISNLVHEDYSRSENMDTKCYATSCTAGGLVVTVGESVVTCPPGGGNVGVAGFTGFLTCPPAAAAGCATSTGPTTTAATSAASSSTLPPTTGATTTPPAATSAASSSTLPSTTGATTTPPAGEAGPSPASATSGAVVAAGLVAGVAVVVVAALAALAKPAPPPVADGAAQSLMF